MKAEREADTVAAGGHLESGITARAVGPLTSIPPILDQVLREPGDSLPIAIRIHLEPQLSVDLSNVRVHTGTLASEAANAFEARALTFSNHVIFGSGEFQPGTPRGDSLIRHELVHTVQQSKSIPTVQRQPKDKPPAKPPDPLEELGKIVSGRNPRAKLKAWLDAHPSDVSTAKTFLLKRAQTSTSEKEWEVIGSLLVEVFTKDPTSTERKALREDAEAKTMAVWDQYTSAAFVATLHDWASDPKERRRIVSRLATKPEQAQKTKDLDALKKDSGEALAQLKKDRVALMKAMRHSLSVLPLSVAGGGSLFAQEETTVTQLLHMIERGIASAEGLRTMTYMEVTTRKPEAGVVAEIASLNKQRDAAEATVKAAQTELEEAKKLTGTTAAAKVRAATAKLKKAEDRRSAVAAARARATPAAARTMKYQEDPTERQRIDTALIKAMVDRAEFLKFFSNRTKLSFSLLDDTAAWWFYWRFITKGRDGFEGFPMEHVLLPILMARNKMITAPRATGIEADTRPDTYAGHGWGQYDLNAPAGTPVKVVQPASIDLSPIWGGQSWMFEWVGSRVSAVFGQDPRQTEKDVLDKLAYGFFGRDREFEKKIEETDLEAGGLPKNRSPEPNRLVAGLLFRSTVAGSALEIEKRLVDLRAELEKLLEDSPEFSGLRVDEDQEILTKTFDASAGDFGTANLLNRDAFLAAGAKTGIPSKVINAFNTSIRRILKEDNDFTRAVFTLLQERLAHLKATGGLEAGRKQILDWAGPSVYVVHHYRETGGTRQVWIRVNYLHLRNASAVVTKESKDPLTVGEVGAGGGAVNPHVHMSIAVFLTEPTWNTSPVYYIDPTDFFGMVKGTPFKTAKP